MSHLYPPSNMQSLVSLILSPKKYGGFSISLLIGFKFGIGHQASKVIETGVCQSMSPHFIYDGGNSMCISASISGAGVQVVQKLEVQPFFCKI